jgi:hypothetical protein
MKIRTLAILLLLVGTVCLAVAFFLIGHRFPAFLSILFIIAWCYALLRQWRWANGLGLVALWVIIGWGAWLQLSRSLLLAGLFALLAGWDLADFSARLSQVEADAGHKELIRRHLFWLTTTLAIALGCVLLALSLDLTIHLGWMIMIAILAALGLGRIVSHLMRIT